jgi:chemotaxis protein histidine kinase CheA
MISHGMPGSRPRTRTQFLLPLRTAGSFLVVTCGQVHLALPARFIRGILRPEEAADANALQGIYRVTELTARLDLPPSPPTPESRIVLFGRYDEHYAFRVDDVQSQIEVAARDIRPLPPHFNGEERGWFSGFFFFGDGVALLLNLNWLIGRETGSLESASLMQTELSGTQVLELEVASDGDDAPWAES